MVTETHQHEDEIYSTMFTSLKHPVRRKILRMLGQKPMTFTEIVGELEISSPNLTYHLESLGELVYKMDNDRYKLSAFGQATINAMKSIEEVREVEPKRRTVTSRWRMFSIGLMVAVILLASFAALQSNSINELASVQQSLTTEIQRLQAYGAGSDKAFGFLKNVTKLDTTAYAFSLVDNDVITRPDLGGMAEENIEYSLDDGHLNRVNVNLRFFNNHFSRYDLLVTESTPLFGQPQPTEVLQNAKFTLARYKAYSGDDYLTKMSNMLDSVSRVENNKEVIDGNLKLIIYTDAWSVRFTWMYTENGIDYQTKGLQMLFQSNILTLMTDGYFQYTIGNANLAITRDQAIDVAKNYVKTLTYNIEGQPVSGFIVQNEPLLSVQQVPHTRGNSVALYPYWYVQLKLNQIYSGGLNVVTVGIYGDTSAIADVQLIAV